MSDNPKYLYYAALTSDSPKGKSEEVKAGRVSLAITTQIAAAGDPSIAAELREADKKALETLKEEEGIVTKIERNGKPVALSPGQQFLIYSLAAILYRDLYGPDIAEKIKDPANTSIQIARRFNLNALSKFLFAKTGQYYNKWIRDRLKEIATITQKQRFKNRRGDIILVTAPLLMIGTQIENLSSAEDPINSVEVIFGASFFAFLDNRFAPVEYSLIKAWRRNKTRLYADLQSILLSVWWQHVTAAKNAERKIRKERGTLSESELEEKISKAKRKALSYEINVSRLKERIGINYDMYRETRNRFWKDLDKAIEGYKEARLIEEAKVDTGAQGQNKILFILSEHYHDPEPEEDRLLSGSSSPG